MSFAEMDQEVLRRCLTAQPRGWEDLVDRLFGVVFHVVDHTAHSRQILLSDAQRNMLGEEVFSVLRHNNMQALRHYRGKSSLATYITIVARRIVVRQLLNMQAARL